jgi:hypothetical protein
MQQIIAVNIKRYILLLLVCTTAISCSFNHAFFKRQPSEIDIPDSVYVEYFSIKNSSDKKISAALFKPLGEVKATVFMIKGNSGDISKWYDIISIMLRNGYQVFTYDFEGMGESEGRATHKNVLTDSQLLLKNIRKRDDVKGKKLILWGFSFGGNLAVKLAVNNPGVFDLMVIEGAFSSQRSVTIKRLPWIAKPLAVFSAHSPYPSKRIISDIKRLPVIVVHSVEDKQIPFSMGTQLFKAANEPKLFFEILGEHCNGLKDYEEEYFQKVGKMLNAPK